MMIAVALNNLQTTNYTQLMQNEVLVTGRNIPISDTQVMMLMKLISVSVWPSLVKLDKIMCTVSLFTL
jgi:hypothetical protein